MACGQHGGRARGKAGESTTVRVSAMAAIVWGWGGLAVIAFLSDSIFLVKCEGSHSFSVKSQ